MTTDRPRLIGVATLTATTILLGGCATDHRQAATPPATGAQTASPAGGCTASARRTAAGCPVGVPDAHRPSGTPTGRTPPSAPPTGRRPSAGPPSTGPTTGRGPAVPPDRPDGYPTRPGTACPAGTPNAAGILRIAGTLVSGRLPHGTTVGDRRCASGYLVADLTAPRHDTVRAVLRRTGGRWRGVTLGSYPCDDVRTAPTAVRALLDCV